MHLAGIEPASSGWKPDILPLNYRCSIRSKNQFGSDAIFNLAIIKYAIKPVLMYAHLMMKDISCVHSNCINYDSTFVWCEVLSQDHPTIITYYVVFK